MAYIHLNPFRAGIVADVAALKADPFTGHSALMGKRVRPWQDTAYVLTLFGRTISEARRNLQKHVLKWSAKGRCPELTGGRFVRSAISRAVQRAGNDADLIAAAGTILEPLEPETSQH